jgi:DNA invertase Pin-like site-specific DNA recombinase
MRFRETQQLCWSGPRGWWKRRYATKEEAAMIGLEKIHLEHRERLAFVYARQSTAAQALHNQTSTARQFALADLAVELGWPKAAIEVIDDLGRSGKFSEGREGFQRMAAEMSLGRVGAVLSLDASRLARSSADWHRLLEIAALTRTLLIDEGTIYDPRDPNDRLVLGMKGTMADFELLWLRQRMDGGRWYLARRGEYRMPVPAGYIYEDTDSSRFSFDHDEEVCRAIKLVFSRFRHSGTIQGVVEHFAGHGLRLPARINNVLVWSAPARNRIRNILANPAYAGVYAFGRKRTEVTLQDGVRRRHLRALSRAEWPVMIEGAHPAYITLEEYLKNEKRLSDNGPRRLNAANRGAVREGRALLQGLLLCERCGARPAVEYRGNNGRSAVYLCRTLENAKVGERCLLVQIGNVDAPIVKLVLEMLTHQRLLDAVRVIEIVEQQSAATHRQWQLRLEKARYEAKRAERQHDACEPENRIVGRSLEKRWNDRLLELERIEQEYEQHKSAQRFELSELDRRRILALVSDLPKLWNARTTDNRDRKLLLRLLIKDVSVKAVDVPRASLRVRVLWHTNAVTELELERPGRPLKGEAPTYRVISTVVPDLNAAKNATKK